MLQANFLCFSIKQYFCGMRWNCTHNENVTVCFVAMELHFLLRTLYVKCPSYVYTLLCSFYWHFMLLVPTLPGYLECYFLVHTVFISSSTKCSFLNMADGTVCVTYSANRYIDVRQYSGSN